LGHFKVRCALALDTDCEYSYVTTRCASCDQAVCRACSSIRVWRWPILRAGTTFWQRRKVRICRNCYEQYEA